MVESLASYRNGFFEGFTAAYSAQKMAFESASIAYCKGYLNGYQRGRELRLKDDEILSLVVGLLGADPQAEKVHEGLLQLRAAIASLREKSALQGRKGELRDQDFHAQEVV